MTNSTVTVPTVTIEAPQGAAEAEILTPQALEFLGGLASNFEAERQRLLAARVVRGEALRTGKTLRFSAGNRLCPPGVSGAWLRYRPICRTGEPRSRARSIARW